MPPKKEKKLALKTVKLAATKPAAAKPAATVQSKAPTQTAQKPKTTPPIATLKSKPAAVPAASKPKPLPAKPVAPKPAATKPAGEYIGASGKRKTAIARVRLMPKGTGKIMVNERLFEEYFPVHFHQLVVRSPLKLAGKENDFDFHIQAQGGGINAQADACRHGISKALLLVDPALRGTLKRAGFLTRDARVKERKKYGLHRARRAPQFSKR